MIAKWTGNLTDHFTIDEYMVGNSKNATLEITREVYEYYEKVVESFRVWLDRPMIITSAKRSKSLNKSVGGIASSNHLRGMAIDWHTNIPLTEARAIKYMKKYKEICELAGLVGEAGLYNGFMHFGIQNDKQIKANKGKFVNWDSRSGKQKNNAFNI